MKLTYRLFFAFIILAPLSILSTSVSGFAFPRAVTAVSISPLADTSWNLKKASAWFNAGPWKNGIKFKPHSSIDKLAFARHYASNKSRWDMAFAYLKTVDLKAIKVGHYQIDGEDVYANVTDAPSKDFEQTQYEVHQNYSDIHMMISGKEKIGVTTMGGATVKTAYDSVKDIGFWNKTGGQVYTGEPGTFFIFCVGTPHRPTIKVAGEKSVKKIVVKIRSAGK